MKSQKLCILLVFLLLTIATSADTKASSSQVQLDTICGKWLVVQVYVGAFTFPAKAILPDGAANPYIVYGGPDLVAGNYYCIYDPVIELISPPDRTPDGYSISQKITGWSTIEPAGGQLPSAEFDAWPQSGSAPLRVSMHIVSTDNISSCLWEYGDGTTGTSCDVYHDHVYTSGGSYTIKLTVTGPSGSNTMTRSSYITVTAATVCYTLTKGVNPSNTGSIIAFPIPNCADGKYAAGTQLSLVATPLSGYQFTSWSGSLSGNANPATLLMDADKSVTATFSQSSFCNAVTEIPQTECEALITFYNSTNGAGWSNNDNWLDTTSPCSWFGVVCNNNHVVQLVLPNNQLNGALPQQLSALTNLQALSLYVNQLSGPIPPALGSLASLISLSLSDNQLSGSIPASLGSLSNLQLLHAHGNQFSGGIPTQLGYLTNLLELDLAKNQLSGSMPTQIGNLTKLEKLGLGSNQLSGNIPSEISKLTKLVGINLSDNQLSGNLPAQIGELNNLDFLSIENNSLSGALPGSLINLNKLVHFWFNNTNLCEPGDNSFQNWLTRISDLNRTGVICTVLPTITPTPTNTLDTVALDPYIWIGNVESPYLPNVLTLAVTVTAKSVGVSTIAIDFYDGNPDGAGSKLISSKLIDKLGLGASKLISATWLLGGNIENHRIYARASTLSEIDPNLSNNTTSQPISVYYVDFKHNRDMYSFSNSDVGVITNGDIIDYLNDFDIPEILYSPLLPIFGILTEVNGHCYGMSNSSIIYFQHPELKPMPAKATFDHTILEARAKVRTYQWYQMNEVIGILLGLKTSDVSEQYRLTLENIKKGQPVIHGMMNRTDFLPKKGSHAVVAYKIIDLGAEKRVYYYDNNLPLNKFSVGGVETYGVFTNGKFSEPFYRFGYNKAYVLEPNLSFSDEWRSLIIQLAKQMLSYQFSNSLISVTTRGSLNLLATDSNGRRSGYVADQEINEIPGAELTKISEMQSLILPTNNQYQFQISNTVERVSQSSASNLSLVGATSTSLEIVDPATNLTAHVIQFKNFALEEGQNAKIQFVHGIERPTLSFQNGLEVAPDVYKVVDMANLEYSLFLPLITR